MIMLRLAYPNGKRCTKCGRWFADVTVGFYITRGRPTSRCRDCLRAENASRAHLYRAAHKAKQPIYSRTLRERLRNRSDDEVLQARARLRPDGTKRCIGCRKTLPLDAFGRDKYQIDGLNARCRDCNRQNKYASCERSKDLERTPRRCRKCGVLYKNPIDGFHRSRGRFQPVCKSCVAAYHAEYHRRYPEKLKARKARRRAREAGAPGQYTAADVRRQLRAQRGRCYWCGAKLGDDYHVDHVIPLAKGGSNGPENIVCACGPCNLSKGDKMPADFAGVLL